MRLSAIGNQMWKKSTLKDLVFFQRGFDITKAQQEKGDVPVISSSGIQSYHSSAKVPGPGVIIGRKGSLGTVYYSEVPYWPHDTTLWSKDLRGNNPRFVYYFMQTLELQKFDVGNSNPTLNRNHIHQIEINIPSLDIQERIALILQPYDDLIDSNQRRIALLEQSARLLYKEWFIHLRFPGHEHVKIVDGVPEGWKKLRVKDMIQRIPAGKLFDQKSALPKGKIPVLDQGRSGLIGYHNDAPSVEASLNDPIIVFANHTCYQRIIHYPFSSIQNVLPYKPNEVGCQ